MNVRWVKSVQAFASLPSCDQIILLEESWSELFVLAAAQFALPIETGILMTAANMSGLFSSSPSSVSQITKFQETVAKFKQMNVDATEYACLRAVTLFKTCKLVKPSPIHFIRKIETNCIFYLLYRCRIETNSVYHQYSG